MFILYIILNVYENVLIKYLDTWNNYRIKFRESSGSGENDIP